MLLTPELSLSKSLLWLNDKLCFLYGVNADGLPEEFEDLLSFTYELNEFASDLSLFLLGVSRLSEI